MKRSKIPVGISEILPNCKSLSAVDAELIHSWSTVLYLGAYTDAKYFCSALLYLHVALMYAITGTCSSCYHLKSNTS
jgi:hypothetical protein